MPITTPPQEKAEVKTFSQQTNPIAQSYLNGCSIRLENGVKIEMQQLVNLAFEAGEKIMQIYGEDFDVNYKEDNSPLTRADTESNEIICQKLQADYPQIAIVSEESRQLSFSERKHKKYVWFIDPLDGTKEFLKKSGEFTVNIGLVENGTPILGVVNIPALKMTYFAAKGRGAFKLDHKTKQLTSLHVAKFSNDEPNLRLVVSLSHRSKETDEFVARFKNPTCVSAGSSLKLLMVAEGSADIYPRIAPTMEWDTCAAHAIVLESGGRCINSDTNESLSYNKENLRNPYFVCHGHCKENSMAQD